MLGFWGGVLAVMPGRSSLGDEVWEGYKVVVVVAKIKDISTVSIPLSQKRLKSLHSYSQRNSIIYFSSHAIIRFRYFSSLTVVGVKKFKIVVSYCLFWI